MRECRKTDVVREGEGEEGVVFAHTGRGVISPSFLTDFSFVALHCSVIIKVFFWQR